MKFFKKIKTDKKSLSISLIILLVYLLTLIFVKFLLNEEYLKKYLISFDHNVIGSRWVYYKIK
jgi:hypothetical protein